MKRSKILREMTLITSHVIESCGRAKLDDRTKVDVPSQSEQSLSKQNDHLKGKGHFKEN